MASNLTDPAIHSPHDPISLFHEQVPDAFLKDLLRGVLTAWRDADQKTREEHEEPERHDLFPHQRRAILERELRGVGRKHGLAASPEKNIRKTASYTRVVCGRVIITASAVHEADEIVRHADFRLSFARSSQMCMFAEAVPVLPDAPLYALILHGPGAMESDEDGNTVLSTAKPGFVDVVFPAPVANAQNKIEYVGGRVHLLDRFGDVLNESQPIKTEEVEFVAEPTLRKQKHRKEAGA
jgi:hypothetical protein